MLASRSSLCPLLALLALVGCGSGPEPQRDRRPPSLLQDWANEEREKEEAPKLEEAARAKESKLAQARERQQQTQSEELAWREGTAEFVAGKASAKASQWNEAMSHFERASALGYTDPELDKWRNWIRSSRAREAFKAEQWETAIEVLTEAARLGSLDIEGATMLREAKDHWRSDVVASASASEKAGEPEDAVSLLERASQVIGDDSVSEALTEARYLSGRKALGERRFGDAKARFAAVGHYKDAERLAHLAQVEWGSAERTRVAAEKAAEAKRLEVAEAAERARVAVQETADAERAAERARAGIAETDVLIAKFRALDFERGADLEAWGRNDLEAWGRRLIAANPAKGQILASRWAETEATCSRQGPLFAARLERRKAANEDWKRRGSPESEKAALVAEFQQLLAEGQQAVREASQEMDRTLNEGRRIYEVELAHALEKTRATSAQEARREPTAKGSVPSVKEPMAKVKDPAPPAEMDAPSDAQSSGTVTWAEVGGVLAGMAFAFSVAAWVVRSGRRNACPECQAWWGIQQLGSERRCRKCRKSLAVEPGAQAARRAELP